MLNRRTGYLSAGPHLQRVPCVVLKLRKIHTASRAEQLHVKTDSCVSKCLSGLTHGFVSPAEVDEHFRAKDLAFVFVLSLSLYFVNQDVTSCHMERSEKSAPLFDFGVISGPFALLTLTPQSPKLIF